MKLASYDKTIGASGTTFTVQPAGRPSLGCAGGMLYGMAAVLAGLVSGAIFDGLAIPVGVGVFILLLRKGDFRPAEHKKPSTFLVTSTGVSWPGGSVRHEDIHRLDVRNHYDRSQEVVLTGQTISTGTALGVDAKHALRAVLFRLQLEAGGRAHVLAAGLDETTAHGLHTDVQRALDASRS